MKITLNNVRTSFVQVFEPRAVLGEGKPAFSCTFLIPPDHPQKANIERVLAQVAKEKWGAKGDTILKQLQAQNKTALHDGNTKAEYEGFAGNYYISARNTQRPTVLDADKTPLVEADGRPYSGCYVNAIIDIWPQDNNYGKRINASLLGIQFLRDGDAFGGGVAVTADDFEDVSEGAMADDLV